MPRLKPEKFLAIFSKNRQKLFPDTAETSALAEAMSELKMSQGIIVTRNGEEQILVDSGKIDVVPIWRFLLNLAKCA